MPLGTALADIELGLAENSNKEDAVTVFVSVERRSRIDRLELTLT